MRIARFKISVFFLAGLVVISRAGASGMSYGALARPTGMSNSNYGTLSLAPTTALSPLALNSIQPGMDAAAQIMSFQPKISQFQPMLGLPHSDVNRSGVWNGVGQMPNAFWQPWEIQYNGSSQPFDYRINTTFYSEALGPLLHSTDGSTLPWEMSVGSVFTGEGRSNVNMGSAPSMMPTLVPLDVPDYSSLNAI